MITEVLEFLRTHLADSLARRLPTVSGEPAVILASPSDRETEGGAEQQGKLVLTLVNLEREAFARNAVPHSQQGSTVNLIEPLNLNLFVLLSSSPASPTSTAYSAAMKQLEAAIGVFQAQPVLTAQLAPTLPPAIRSLSVEFVSLDLIALNALWSTLGSSYLPSALYKIRFVAVDTGLLQGEVPVVTGIAPK